MQRSVCLTALAVALCAACGGGGVSNGISGPSPTSTPAQAPPPAAASFSVQFTYDDGVSASDRQLIEEALAKSQEFFQQNVGRGMTGSLPVRVKSSGCHTATGGANGIDLCTGIINTWPTSRTRRFEVVTHEAFHVVQHQSGWFPSWWMTEGSAEYVAFAAVVSWGMVSYEQLKTCQSYLYHRQGLTEVPSLKLLNGGFDPAYTVAWLGWDRLLGGIGGVTKVSGSLRGMSFDSAYGISEDQFSAAFEDYRRTISNPGMGSCAVLS